MGKIMSAMVGLTVGCIRLLLPLTSLSFLMPILPAGSMVAGEEDNPVLEKLVGTWIVVSIDAGNEVQELNGFKMVISKKIIFLQAPNGAKKLMGDIRRIDGQARPGQIDLRKGKETGLGIFELDGDYLKLIIRDPGQERPTEFKGTPTGMLFTLKRERR